MLKDKDSKQSIQVTIRVRPLSDKQLNEDSRTCVRLQQSNSLHLAIGTEIKKFTFDSICFNESQQQMFNRVGKRCTVDCLEGYNCTIFAYGQTGAGKTYTMMGVNFESENYYQSRGLIPRTMQFLFECIERQRENGVNFVIRCSFLEIYNQQIIDLLNKANSNMQLREDTRKGVYVEGITEEIITKSEEAMEILYKGSKSRHVGSTFYNETSSRSHSVFTMQIESKYTKNGVSNTKSRQFNFIDLAGSERTKQSTGERLKEGCNINKSLMNLAAVINALSEVSEGKMQHVNYRNSKLTFLLKDSLGGNSKTNLIANISPATVFYQETLSTLGFARRAKLIKREKASINEDSTGNLQSMKNEIKRLKQEVINLMSHAQPAINDVSNQPEKPSQMTAIMHQYVEEEIDKQTKLELEILKLNDRIIHLQNGIKQYSNNQIHLRMIISVYEDKINRLKSIEKTIGQGLNALPQSDEDSRTIVAYFKNERNNFIKELENIRAQSDNNKFLKQLLKEAKIMKDDGQDESLKELLVKNTNFLNVIRCKLDEMKPEKIEFEINSEFEKKITLMSQLHSKKQEEYQERLDQISLDLTDWKNRSEENEKLLEEAISGHILLEQKIKEEQFAKQKLTHDLEACNNKLKQTENEAHANKVKSEETIGQLKSQISNKEAQACHFRKELDLLKVKLEKAALHQTALKAQFENLEEQKYRVDKSLLQSMEELRETKNSLLKTESEVTLLHHKIQALTSQNDELKIERSKLHETIVLKESNFKVSLEQTEKSYRAELEERQSQSQILMKQIQDQQNVMKQLHEKLESQASQLKQQMQSYKQMQQEYEFTLVNKEEKLKEMLQLVNEKQVNGNETIVQLNQMKVDLINAHSEIETLEAKYKKSIEELKEKLQKEQASCEHAEGLATERSRQCDALSSELQQRKRECAELTQSLNKANTKLNIFQQEINNKEDSIEEMIAELDVLKNREKEQKLALIQMKNQLFLSQRNSEIQADALKSQLILKDQQCEHLEKQLIKNKQRLEKQIEELKKEIVSINEQYKNQQESLNRTMELHLAAKEKKILELKQVLSEREERLKQLEEGNFELHATNCLLSEAKAKLLAEIELLEVKSKEMNAECMQLKQQLEQSMQKSQKEAEEMEIIHNEQIDQKNQQIQSYMLENEALNTRLQETKSELQQFRNVNSSLINQINTKNENYKVIFEQNMSFQEKMINLRKEFDEYIIAQQKQSTQIKSESESKLIEVSEQRQELQHRMKELDIAYTHSQEEKGELEQTVKSCQGVIERLNSESSDYVNTISLLTQENYGLNQQLNEHFKDRKERQAKIAQLQAALQQVRTEMQAEISKVTQANDDLSKQLSTLNETDLNNKQKLVELNRLTNDLTKSLESQRQAASNLMVTNNSLQETVGKLKASLSKAEELLHAVKARETSLTSQLQESNIERLSLNDANTQLNAKCSQITEKYLSIEAQLSKSNEQLRVLTASQQELRERYGKEMNAFKTQSTFLVDQNRKQASQIINLSKIMNEAKVEGNAARQRVAKFEAHHQKLNAELEQLHLARQRWQLQGSEMERLRSQVEEERSSKERIYNQLCREKQNSGNLKLLIQNKSAQVGQLEVELEEKDAIYKKLVEKIARNENQNKKSTNSEHYLKTIELLEKSRAEQIELRRQNEELKKVMLSMKESIEQKETHVREVEQKSEAYCVSMHKRMEEIQNDYVELERTHQKLIKERKLYSHDNEQLKEELRALKASAAKITQKNEEMEAKIKKANLDYIQLEKDYEQAKRAETLLPSTTDEKTIYINRLKAEVAALKTEKVLLSETLNKEREEKTKLKAEMRYGKEGGETAVKVQLEKKLNENKNLTELIFEIISQLKICVNEPKAKLEVIRSIILGAIKDKNAEIKTLKDKIRECETEHHRNINPNPPKIDYAIHHNTRELKALSISNSNREDPLGYKFEKDKDPSFLNNNSRQKMKEFQKYYAQFKSQQQEFDGKK